MISSFSRGFVDAIPRFELTGFLVRKSQLAVAVFGGIHVNLHLVADLQIGIVAELGVGDDALALVADVHQYLAFGDTRDGAFDHFADVDVRERFVVSCGNLLFGLVIDAQIPFERIPVELVVRNRVFTSSMIRN